MAGIIGAAAAGWALAVIRHLGSGALRATPARMRRLSDGQRGSWPLTGSPARGPVHGATKPRRRRRGAVARGVAAMAGDGEVKDIHRADSIKTLLKNEAVYKYILNMVVYPREHECLRELRLLSQKHTEGFMSSPPDEAQLLSMLLKLTGARNTIEVGVFTGCSVLATALAIPDDGKVVAIDVSREYFDIGLPVIQKAGVAHKVDFREGPAQPILDDMLAVDGSEGKYDFSFVDTDKENYGNYHERLLRLVRVGGVLAYDNTLWGGTVRCPTTRRSRMAIGRSGTSSESNAMIAADQRVEVVQIPVADGITLCRRII